ncbi:MAG: hypothetical protein ACHBN1_04570 [Heteroscytonema crispum UTEX LB 1556]
MGSPQVEQVAWKPPLGRAASPPHWRTNNQQPQRGSPVAWVGKPYQGRWFTNNQLTPNSQLPTVNS